MNRRAGIRLLGGLAALACASITRAQAFAEGPQASAWFERAGRLAGFRTGPGDAAPAAVIFFDARCPHCTRLWTDVRRHEGAAPLHWVPVVLLSPASARQGAALLRAGDPGAAMDAHARSLAQGGEGIAADDEPDDEETRALKESTAMLRAMEVGSVPAVLHRDSGGRIGLTVGAMPASRLMELLGG